MKTNNVTSPPRERVSVAISGIDRSTPDILVQDGKCETLHNMRYSAEAWRPVHPYKTKSLLTNLFKNFNIVYKHPAAPENIYIIELKKNNSYYYYTYDTTRLYTSESELQLLVDKQTEPLKISHFGNVLMFASTNNTYYFIHNNGVYSRYEQPKAPILTISNEDSQHRVLPDYIRLSSAIPSFTDKSGKNYNGLSKDAWYSGNDIGEILKIIKAFNTISSASPTFHCLWLVSDATNRNSMIPHQPVSTFGDPTPSFHGEFALFATYRTASGAIVSQSPIHICCSDDSLVGKRVEMSPFFTTYPMGLLNGVQTIPPDRDANRTFVGIYVDIDCDYGNVTVADIREYSPISYANTHVDVSLTRPNTHIIASVAIYATRLYPIFDASYVQQDFGEVEPRLIWADNKLPEQPFYCLWEQMINVDDEGDYEDRYSLDIDALMLERNINNSLYTPTITSQLVPNVSLDYNNALHIADTTEILSSSSLLDAPMVPSESGVATQAAIAVKRNDKTYHVVGDSYLATTNRFADPFSRIISYHDAYATAYHIMQGKGRYEYPLRSAMGNGLAYYVAKPTNEYKYGTISLGGSQNILFPSGNNSIERENIIFVSSDNDCLTFSYDRVYRVGSANNRILALQSAAIEMPEMKVGEMPLYAFTEEGIFALIAGSETLYARVSPINYDRIINPNTLAINGAIVYITEKGVHLLSNQGTQVISTPINDKTNIPPLDFLRTCKLIRSKEYNEIILHNEGNTEGIAYVFNLDAGYWSTRDLKGVKLNTDEIYDNNVIYDLANEDESKALACSIETRPIKLGNVEFKRLETIIPRMAPNDNGLTLSAEIEGSVDGSSYIPLRSIDHLFIESNKVNPITIRRTPFSAKYFKMSYNLEPTGNDKFNPTFSHIDIEWYSKLRHRMR